MTIEEATFFWLEAGDMSGGSRNQIEFTDDLVTFFDEQSRSAGQVFIAYDKETKAHCPLTNRGQDYDQWTNKWRLGLITKAKGGVDYQGRVIRFEKRKVGRNFAYVITVADRQSALHEEWKAKSAQVGSTFGPEGRPFGFF
jgi:hypothetical protein